MRCWLVRKCCFVCSNNETRIYTTMLSPLVFSDTLHFCLSSLTSFLAPPLAFPAFLLFSFLVYVFFSVGAFLPPFFLPSYLPTILAHTYTRVHVCIYLPFLWIHGQLQQDTMDMISTCSQLAACWFTESILSSSTALGTETPQRVWSTHGWIHAGNPVPHHKGWGCDQREAGTSSWKLIICKWLLFCRSSKTCWWTCTCPTRD